jgi:hypothetical protein
MAIDTYCSRSILCQVGLSLIETLFPRAVIILNADTLFGVEHYIPSFSAGSFAAYVIE